MTQHPSSGENQLEIRRRAVGQALEAHRARVGEALESGDPRAIKQLYIELGDLLQEGAQGEIEAIPVLSFAETGPVVAALARGTGGRLLDAGCGPNPIVSIMLGGDRRLTIVGIDIGHGTVRLARSHAESLGVRFLAVVGDLEALPFADSVFDGSVCEDTIEHVPNDRAGVAELARVMRAGGRLVLATPNRRRLDVLVQRLRDRRRGVRRPDSAYYAATSHLREYTWRDLEQLVGPVFRTNRRATVGWSGGWRSRVATQLVRWWPGREVSRVLVLALEPRKAVPRKHEGNMTSGGSGGPMRAYWDERARRNAAWYVDTTLDYDQPDLTRFFADGEKTVRWAVDRPFLSTPGNSLAVEIGSGLGRISKALAQRFDAVVGIDVSPEMVQRAREMVTDERIRFEVSDGSSLGSVRDGSADLVFSFTVFQHIPSRLVVENYIAEAGRVLRPGGWMVFQWSNAPHAALWAIRRRLLSSLQRIGLVRERYERHAPEFLGSRIPLRRIARALDRAGLDIVASEGTGTLFAFVWARKRT